MATQTRHRKPTHADFEKCQGVLKHRMDTMVDTSVDADIVLVCDRCTTRRLDWIDRAGDVAKRKYEWPDGYKRANGSKRPSIADMRLKLVKELTAAAGKKPRRR